MALTSGLKFEGSGEYVHEHEWSCSAHDSPRRHECDCSDCTKQWDCESCATAEWVDLFNEDGSPKMRELSTVDVYFRNLLVREYEETARILDWLSKPGLHTGQPIIWNEGV